MSLNNQVAKSALWMVCLRTSIKAIGFVSTIILARLLTPEDFGLVAIIMSFFALIEVFGNFGFDTVLIQKQNATPEDYNTAWSFNVTFGLIAFVLVASVSGLVADFYGNQKLKPIMLALSLLFLNSGLQNIGVVDFRKNLTFDKEFKFQILPKIISFFCTMGLAFWLRNYWALVLGSLIWKGCITINSYLLHSFRPRFTYASWRELFNFSKWLMLNNFFYFANTRSPEMILGKVLSPQAAGFFTMAQEISTLPTTELASNINRATYPGYSKISHQPEKLKEMYLNVIASVSLMVMPAGVGVAAIAPVLIPVALGTQWDESIALVQYLAVAGAIIALNSNAPYIFIAMGKPKIATIIQFIRVCVFIPVLIWLSYSLGLIGASLAVLGVTVLTFFVVNITIGLTLRIFLRDFLAIYFRPLTSSAIMWLLLSSAMPLIAGMFYNYKIINLFLIIILGAITYTVSILLLWALFGYPKGPETHILNLLKSKLSSI